MVYYTRVKSWIVVMEKTATTIDNEKEIAEDAKNNEFFVDMRHAKFIADQMFVIDIFNKYDNSIKLHQIVDSTKDDKIFFEVGKTSFAPIWRNEKGNIASGICYYASLPACMWSNTILQSVPSNYTGIYIRFYDNGLLDSVYLC